MELLLTPWHPALMRIGGISVDKGYSITKASIIRSDLGLKKERL
jgi:hypothetical protein